MEEYGFFGPVGYWTEEEKEEGKGEIFLACLGGVNGERVGCYDGRNGAKVYEVCEGRMNEYTGVENGGVDYIFGILWIEVGDWKINGGDEGGEEVRPTNKNTNMNKQTKKILTNRNTFNTTTQHSQ